MSVPEALRPTHAEKTLGAMKAQRANKPPSGAPRPSLATKYAFQCPRSTKTRYLCTARWRCALKLTWRAGKPTPSSFRTSLGRWLKG